MSHTPGPWRIERGGGHAHNGIYGAESIQTNGWPERRGGISNASYSDRVCENLGDLELPGPAANARLIAAAPDLLEVATRYLEAAKSWHELHHTKTRAAALQCDWFCELIPVAEAAIANATGASPNQE